MARPKRKRKHLLIALKLLIAFALLGWVISKVHWRDYVVVDRTAEAYPVFSVQGPEDGPLRFEVQTGPLWDRQARILKADKLRRVGEGTGAQPYLHMGFASSMAQLSAWHIVAGLGGFFLTMLLIARALGWLLQRREGYYDD